MTTPKTQPTPDWAEQKAAELLPHNGRMCEPGMDARGHEHTDYCAASLRAGVAEALRNAFDEGCSKQAILELAGRDRFIKTLKEKQSEALRLARANALDEAAKVADGWKTQTRVTSAPYTIFTDGREVAQLIRALKGEVDEA